MIRIFFMNSTKLIEICFTTQGKLFYYFCAMFFIDTHTHLYLNAFDDDREAVVERAVEKEVRYMLLPNIDSSSVTAMHSLCKKYPGHCFPMMGLHPTSVKENFKEELDQVVQLLSRSKYVAVGEIGIDLYWDKTYREQQEEAFRFQVDLAMENDLPVVIHSRESIDELIEILSEYNNQSLRGVFHCFTGNKVQADKIIKLGFLLGIGGVLTFKNSNLSEVIRDISLSHLILETDSPFLAPAPYRGKRNESSYVRIIARKLADIMQVEPDEVARITSKNAMILFKMNLT
jgi:TatD DNase family protein